MGFLKFLKVEQDIDLSPEEYKMALEMEIEAQRKKYYIGGVVKDKNLLVPWRPIVEKELEKDARKQLRKNGIKDPSGEDESEQQEDSKVDISVLGQQDVRLSWSGGTPGQKVGYIVERKSAQQTNFKEIATYDNLKNPQLLAKSYAGHDYNYVDEIVPPGKYTYRVLCRVRSGEISVLDQKDVVINELGGIDGKVALVILAIVVIVSTVAGTLLDPVVS